MPELEEPRADDAQNDAAFGESLPEDDTLAGEPEEAIRDDLLDDDLPPDLTGDEAEETFEELSEELLEVPALEEIEEALEAPLEERVPPLILMSAVIGLVVGLFVWGSLAISVMSSTEGVISDLSTDSEGAFDIESADLVLDCGDADASRFLSTEQRAILQERCASPTPEPEETPEPDPALNRADCDAIRGTDYRSVEEREWFLDNCIEG